MKYIYETHLHTNESSVCGKTPAKDYISYYKDRGYSGIVVTDHFYGSGCFVPDRSLPWHDQVDQYCLGYETALNEGIKQGFDVYFGIEQCFEIDEVLIYGVDKKWLYDNPDIRIWNRRELYDNVHRAGGCVVHAHPFRVRDYVRTIILNSCVDAVEAFNAQNRPQDDVYGKAFACYLNFPMTAGTDMHHINPADTDDRLYGVVFDAPWMGIKSYVQAILNRESFGVKVPENRGAGEPQPLERPWQFQDELDRPISWDPKVIFPGRS